jgi:hypothetical protein
MASASTFPFLSHLVEIRLMVYRMLMSVKAIGNVVSITAYTFCQSEIHSEDEECQKVQLYLSSQMPRVCRQIYQEAIMVLYSEDASKTVDGWFWHEDVLKHFLSLDANIFSLHTVLLLLFFFHTFSSLLSSGRLCEAYRWF